jgi:hypothetical protein
MASPLERKNMPEEEKDSILKRIQKLLKMSEENGASENEAMMAASKVQELLKEHNLSLSDVKDDTEQEPIDRENFDLGKENWRGWIAQATAKLYFCSMFQTTKYENYKRVKKSVFVGRKSNRIVAKSMCDYFEKTVEKLADEEFKTVPGNKAVINRMKHAFKIGCASRLQSRLQEKYSELVPAYTGIDNPDGLPILYKNEQTAISEWLVNQGVKTTTSRSSFSIRDRMAYANGQKKGDGIGLNTQVNAQTRSRMLGQ